MAETYKIAIVGSGPAGLSAASHARKLGMSHVLLEKTDHLSDTIFRYQRGKYVMATPAQLVLRADLDFEAGYRETILEGWNQGIAGAGVNVRFNAEVKGVSGQKGDFTLTLTNGDTVKAEAIVLSIGTQGNPNLMRCPGGNLPHVQYQLDDPTAYIDEHIFIIGAGDAGIENALGLAADPAQANTVSIVNRSADFSRAKEANVSNLLAARDAGRVSTFTEASPSKVEVGWITLEIPDGETRLRCDRVIARLGSSPPRKFVESLGIEFTSDSRDAYPKLSPNFETTAPGIYVIGALAGYPLIKHCMNQGHDVVEFINGNVTLAPADEPILARKLAGLPGGFPVSAWLEFLRGKVEILNGLSPLQMREFLIDSEVHYYRADQVIFERNSIGSSLFGIASGSVKVEVDPANPSVTVPIGTGSIFGEVGLISGRRRGATIRAAEDCIAIEIPRNAALKLMASVKEARDTVGRITTERAILQIFGSGLAAADIQDVLAKAEVKEVKPGEAIIREGEESYDIFIVRRGSMVVEREIGGKTVFLSYIPAGEVAGEMALVDGGRRSATVRAAIRSEVIKLDGDVFRILINRKPELVARLRGQMAGRRRVNAFIEKEKDRFTGVLDYYTSVAEFLVKEGVGEATDILLIDEKLCVGCDNCEKACADAHDGLSRLDREAGRTYANLHVPTSCRHCEHPHCMTDCPPNAIHRGLDGEVYIDDTCIGCGNCQRYCPYGVIRMDKPPPKKPGLIPWLLFGSGPGPGEPDQAWKEANAKKGGGSHKQAIKCDMCSGKKGGPACVRACPTGAAIRVSPENFLSVALLERGRR
jgi:CRP-like cAMP-binding protein/Fe-S-cluster-containing hydrogenase component 2/thioredoxin reductase